MRIPILATATLSALLVAAPHAGGDEPKADKARTVARVDEAEEREFTPPPGFRLRKRGEHTVCCRGAPVSAVGVLIDHSTKSATLELRPQAGVGMSLGRRS